MQRDLARERCLTPPASCPTRSLPSFDTVVGKDGERRRRRLPAGTQGPGFNDAHGLSGGGANGGGIFAGRVRRLIGPRTPQAAFGRRTCHGAGTYLYIMHFLKLCLPRQTVSGSRRHLYTDLFCRGGRSFSCQEATNTISHLEEIYKYISSKPFFFFHSESLMMPSSLAAAAAATLPLSPPRLSVWHFIS